MAAARRWGAAWAWGRAWAPGQRAWSPRGAEPGAGAEPELHGALLQGRGAAGRAELAAAAGRRAGSATSSLGVPGTFTASRGVFFGCFPLLRREGELSGVRLPEARGVAESAGRPAAARGAETARGGLPWVLRPARAVQSSDGLGRTKTQHPVSLARPHAFLFSCLTNPRIIQLRKCWKEVS